MYPKSAATATDKGGILMACTHRVRILPLGDSLTQGDGNPSAYRYDLYRLLDGADIRLNCDYFASKEELEAISEKTVFTGMIDEYFNYCYGELEYRGLNFEFETLNMENYQGNAVVNYTDSETPYTRIIEHKHFEGSVSPKTIITREYPKTWLRGEDAYYPINDEKNSQLYEKDVELSKKGDKVIFGGCLGMYKYFDMWQVIEESLNLVNSLKE